MEEDSKGIAATAALLFCLLCQMPALGADGGGAAGAELLRLRLAEVEKLGDVAVEESICGEVGILDTLWLGGAGRSYYEALMARWEQCATEKSLPVLEGFIKDAAGLRSRQADKQLPWLLFGTIERRGQELWYKLKAADLPPEKRAELTLYGFMENKAPVPIEPGLARKWLVKIGAPGRPAFYRFLESPADGKWDNLRCAKLHGVLVGRWMTDVFRPTPAEIEHFLGRPKSLGYLVILRHMRETNQHEKAYQHLLRLASSGEWDLMSIAFGQLRYMKAQRDEILPLLIGMASREKMLHEFPGRATYPDDFRGTAFRMIAKFGKDPRSVKLFRDYLKKVSVPEAWVGLHPEALGARQRAIEAAIKVLRQWGEWPASKTVGGLPQPEN